MKEKKIIYTMPKEMYRLLLNGRKGSADEPGIKACGTYENVVKYVDETFGLLGVVVEVRVS